MSAGDVTVKVDSLTKEDSKTESRLDSLDDVDLRSQNQIAQPVLGGKLIKPFERRKLNRNYKIEAKKIVKSLMRYYVIYEFFIFEKMGRIPYSLIDILSIYYPFDIKIYGIGKNSYSQLTNASLIGLNKYKNIIDKATEIEIESDKEKKRERGVKSRNSSEDIEEESRLADMSLARRLSSISSAAAVANTLSKRHEEKRKTINDDLMTDSEVAQKVSKKLISQQDIVNNKIKEYRENIDQLCQFGQKTNELQLLFPKNMTNIKNFCLMKKNGINEINYQSDSDSDNEISDLVSNDILLNSYFSQNERLKQILFEKEIAKKINDINNSNGMNDKLDGINKFIDEFENESDDSDDMPGTLRQASIVDDLLEFCYFF